MSHAASKWAWEQKTGAMPKLVLLALADYASREHASAWPSIQTIADQTGMARSSVKRSIEALEKDGLVAVERRGNRSSLYTLTVHCEPAQSEPPVHSEPLRGSERTSQRSTVNHEPVKNLSLNLSKLENEIEALYDAYPRKANRPAALAAIRKALKREADKHDLGMSFPALLEKTKLWNTARSQATAKDEDAAKFTKHAATWFNQQCYLEDSAEWDIKSVTKSWLDVETDQLLRESEASVRATEKMLADLDK